MVQAVSCSSDGTLYHQSRNGKNHSALIPAKIRYKRRIIPYLWVLCFAYLSLTYNIQPTSIGASVLRSQAEGDDSEPNFELTWNPLKNQPENLLKATPYNTSRNNAVKNSNKSESVEDEETETASKLLAGLNCTQPAILDFPLDIFTQEQRENGAIIVHFVVSIYVFYVLALVCDDYFIPAIEVIRGELHMSNDVAGATVMAVATSSPELFTNVIGTFITEGDVGVCTIVGSAMFNILAICACCAFASKTALRLDWYSLARDCIFYSVSVMLLIFVLHNRQVFWYEALVMVGVYAIYIFVMWKNAAFKKPTENFVHAMGKIFGYSSNSSIESTSNAGETTPLPNQEYQHYSPDANQVGGEKYVFTPKHISEGGYKAWRHLRVLIKCQTRIQDRSYGVFNVPHGEGFLVALEWVVSWPAHFLCTITIPDCRKNRKFYPLTFIMCILYLAVLSYVVNWMITVIGHTFRIPDSVMGLTILALGTSIPEAISSIIVARKGLASMSVSSSIGSNTFDILICLGLPWLIRTSMIANNPEGNFVQVNSGGLEYLAIILMISLVLLYSILAWNKFYLDKKVAMIALSLYAFFLVFASLCEMNVFFTVNLPTCPIPIEL